MGPRVAILIKIIDRLCNSYLLHTFFSLTILVHGLSLQLCLRKTASVSVQSMLLITMFCTQTLRNLDWRLLWYRSTRFQVRSILTFIMRYVDGLSLLCQLASWFRWYCYNIVVMILVNVCLVITIKDVYEIHPSPYCANRVSSIWNTKVWLLVKMFWPETPVAILFRASCHQQLMMTKL